MRFLVYIVLLLNTNSALSQANFFRIFSGFGDDYGHGVVEVDDSCFAMTGSSSSFIGGGSQAFLVKTDSLGNYLWSKSYGGLESEVGRRVMYKKNVGYYIAGYTNSIGNGGYDFYLIKTDEAGNQEWEKAYGDFGWERVHDAVMMSDTGILMVGESYSNSPESKNMYIVRTDMNGDTLWTKTIGTDHDDMLTSLHQLNDSIYYLAGSMYIEDSARIKGCVIKIHENGTVYWIKTYGYLGNTFINDIHVTNSEIIGVGYTDKDHDSLLYEHYFRLDLDGNIIKDVYSGSTGERIAVAVTTYGAPDKLYVAYSYWDIWSHFDANDIAIGRFSDTLVWEAQAAVISHYEPDDLNQLIPTADGGAIAIGSTNSAGIGYHHICLVKIGPNEAYPYCLAPHIVNQLVGVNDNLIDFGLEVFPNPANEDLHIISSIGIISGIELLNAFGQNVLNQNIEGIELNLNTSQLEGGIYFLRITVSGKTAVSKIIVQH